MSEIPALKFEKSTNFLNDQLNIQLNNKRLVIDIISNINLILKSTHKKDVQSFSSIQKSANEFLQNISKNITIIEELNREIKHITSDLAEVIEETNKKEKSTEYYIAAISTVKENIEKYTSNFQSFEKKINQDNIDFNEFISKNNFKYNFVSNSDNGSYEFSDFSIDDTVIEKPVSEVSSNGKDEKINKLANEFKSMLSDLSEDAISSLDLISTLKTEFSSGSNSLEEQSEKTAEINEANSSKIVSDDLISNEELEENSNIVIDYSSIYKNYYNNRLSAVEENISSEYSNFYSSSKTSDSKKHEPLFLLDDSDDDIEVIESTEESEPIEEIKETEVVKKNTLIEPINVEENIKPIEIPEPIKPVEEVEQAEEKEELVSNNVEKNSLEEVDLLNENDILQLTDDDILAEILKEEIAKDTTKSDINDIIFNDLDLSNELLAESLLEKETSISDTISDDDILSELLASDEFTANLIEENTKLIENDSKINDSFVNCNDLSDYCNIDEKIQNIKDAKAPNNTLIISEKENKVFLPYTKDELEYLLNLYPQVYHSIEEVIQQEYILPFDVMQKHPAQSRFLETYRLMKNREKKSVVPAALYSLKFLCKYNLSPAVIAACKSKKELDAYLSCLKLNTLNKFTYFKTVYQVNPL